MAVSWKDSLKKPFDFHQNHIPDVVGIIKSKTFSFSAEIIPPRNGTDFLEVFQNVEKLKSAGFEFISVTHGAGGALRGGTLPIAFQSQNVFGFTSIAHLTCRGVTAEELENILIDHHYFGIHNILALRGDPPDGIDESFEPAQGGFAYAYQLVELIRRLNEGKYHLRKGYDSAAIDPKGPKDQYREGMKTRFCIGVACYPEDPDGKDIAYLQRKIEAGAEFAITQMILDFSLFETFYRRVLENCPPDFIVLPGIRVPSSYKQLQRMESKFGVTVCPNLMADMKKVENDPEAQKKVGIEWALDFTVKVKQMGCPGIHFFIMGDPHPVITLKADPALKNSAQSPAQENIPANQIDRKELR